MSDNAGVHLALTLLGFAGAAAVLAAFAAAGSGRLTATGGKYHALNFGGALMLLASGAATGAWPSVASNAAWVVISVTALTTHIRRAPRRARTT